MFTFGKQGMYHACRLIIPLEWFLKQNESDAINVDARLKYSTFSNTHFWPVYTRSVCLDLHEVAKSVCERLGLLYLYIVGWQWHVHTPHHTFTFVPSIIMGPICFFDGIRK